MNQSHDIDKARVRASFAAAAATYDSVAVLQREVGARLLERLDLVRMAPQTVLDVGAGTGGASAALIKRYKGAHVIAMDFAEPMLKRCRQHMRLWRRWPLLCADAEQLPLADASCDLLFSNLTLQWCTDFAATLREWRRVLRPGGLAMFTTLGPDTLKELRQSWSVADGFNHVNAFTDMHDIGDALLRAGFAEPVMDMEQLTLTYADVQALMRELKALGAHTVTAGRAQGLTGPRRLRAMTQAYEGFRREGVLPATYEIVYGHAWAPQPRATEIPLTQLQR